MGLSLAALPEHEAELVGLAIVVDEDIRMWSRMPPAITTPGPVDPSSTPLKRRTDDLGS